MRRFAWSRSAALAAVTTLALVATASAATLAQLMQQMPGGMCPPNC